MLTLLIMAGILLTITQYLRAARSSRDLIHNIQEQQLAGPAILQQIENDLRALTVFDRDVRHVLRVENRVIGGFEADSLDFVATTDGLMPHRERGDDVYRRADTNEVGYHLRANPDSDDFLELYRREDFGIDDEPFQGGQFAFLHDRVKGFEIRVFDEDGVEAEPEDAWGNEGDEFAGVPARLEIELTLELAPRLVREQLVPTRNTVVYKRVFRFPASLSKVQELALVPVVPRITKPVVNTPGAGPGGQQPTVEVQGGGGEGGGGSGGEMQGGGGR
jgi:hypothetical protein